MPRIRTKPETLEARFWAKVLRIDDDVSCWPWTATRDEKGYGRIFSGDRNLLASRVSYELAYGPIPDGKFVCHTCDNPPCVRPSHLFVGTPSDNIQDMMAKGRHYLQGHPERVRHGEQAAHAKLTAAQVQEIRSLAGTVSYGDMAVRFGVDKSAISLIMRGKNWSTLPDERNDAQPRHVSQKGENAPKAKLTEVQVREIRALADSFMRVDLAEMYDVDASTITRIIKRQYWSHVE